MAFRRDRAAIPEPAVTTAVAHRAPQSLVAAAARVTMDGRGWRQYRFGDDGWQQEVWRLYDIIGELRFAANWVGSACSRVRIYVAKVDKNGRIQEEAEEAKVAALADTLFGSPTSKAEALRLLGINLTVAGDAYIVARGTDISDADEWMVVSCSELKRYGGTVNYLWADGRESLDPSRDLVIRVWTPHPRRNLWADSPTRAAMPLLIEIEKLTRFVFAQMDSRLVSAGLLPIPNNTSFPGDDGDPETGAQALGERLAKAGSASLKGEGTAAGVLPTIVEMPLEALGKINLINFASELSQQARELRQEAIHRFALAMDMPPEILTGTGGTNHWSAWHIEESAVKVHIEPLMVRICDALTTAYLKPALKAIGKDPDRFVYWFDTAPLTVRPERLKDTLNMYEKGLVSEDEVRLAGDYPISSAPDLEERMRRFTQELFLRDPNLMQIPELRKIAGYSEEILPAATVVTPQAPGAAGAGPPPPPAPPTGIQPTGPAAIPGQSTAPGAPPAVEGGQPPTNGITASASVPPLTTFVIANAAVLRALELAGKKLLTPGVRGQFKDVPAHELHTHIGVESGDQAARILTGAWDQLALMHEQFALDVNFTALHDALHGYCFGLLQRREPHDVRKLGVHLRDRGLLDGQP